MITPERAQQPLSRVQISLSHLSIFLLSHHRLLPLTDNFYESGIHGSAASPRFNETFETVYAGGALNNIPYYVVAGNHDYLGNVSAQVAYSNVSPRWHFPSLYYKKSLAPAGGGHPTVDLIFIDTVVLAGNSDLQEDEFAPLTGPDPGFEELAAMQWTWIEEQLSNSTADYLFTVGHYPVYSGCEHGNTLPLVLQLKPLLEKYNASGHLSGHDHCEEYIVPGPGPVYLVSGAGKECCYKNKHAASLPTNSVKFAMWNSDGSSPISGAFASFVATPQNLTFTFHAGNGTQLYVTEPVFPRRM